MPSQPKLVSGWPSTRRTTSSTRERSTFSIDTSLSAQVPSPVGHPSASRTVASRVSRSSTAYSHFSTALSISSTASGSVSARKPTRPRFTPVIAASVLRASSEARRKVPSPPKTSTISAPDAASGPNAQTSASGMASASASSSSTRTRMPSAASLAAAERASATMSARPVCTASSTRRVAWSDSQAAVPSVTAPPRTRAWSLWSFLNCSVDVGAVHRRCVPAQPEEELHVAGRAGQRAGHDPGGAPAEVGGRLGDRGDRVGPVPEVADDAAGTEPLPAHLELRLDHGQQVGARFGAGGERGEHQAQGDERQVGDDQVDGAADRLRRQVAHVGALVDDDPLVGAQGPRELAVADVDRHDLPGAALQQLLGEAPGGGPGVQRAAALDRGWEGVQGTEQLVRSAGDPARLVGVGADHHGCAGLPPGGRLGGRLAADGHPALGDEADGVLA